MRYALNVAPINGWETQLGQGQADISLSATGSGYRAFFATGQAAAMALSASGAGRSTIYGAGSSAQSLSASGVPVLSVRPVGSSALALSANGTSANSVRSDGIASASLFADGDGLMATAGSGQSDMHMAGFAGIPRPIIIPDAYSEAHPSRFFVVEAFEQRIDVGAQDLPVVIPTGNRTMNVPEERSVA